MPTTPDGGWVFDDVPPDYRTPEEKAKDEEAEKKDSPVDGATQQ